MNLFNVPRKNRNFAPRSQSFTDKLRIGAEGLEMSDEVIVDLAESALSDHGDKVNIVKETSGRQKSGGLF